MKKIILLLFFIAGIISAQVGYVEYNSPIYEFLERMETQHLIHGYDSFELPKTRQEVADYLLKLSLKKSKLDKTDQKLLDDYLQQFEFDINKTTKKYTSFFPETKFPELLSNKEKFLYFYTYKNKMSFFVNFIGSLKNLNSFEANSKQSRNATLITYGGSISASFMDKFGFNIKATNGTYFGNRSLVDEQKNVKYNYKFNDTPKSNVGSNYFDNTSGYFLADFKYLKFKIGRDRTVIGSGQIKDILSDNSPDINYLAFNLKYKFLSFSYLYGQLLGNETYTLNLSGNKLKNIIEKYFVYHRLGFKISRYFNFGVGEMVIYANRGIDLSYLNPFSFYKSVEHANQDRDNTLLFFDLQNYSFKGLKLFGSLIIDDLNFSKLGTSWLGNQAIMNVGFFSSQFYKIAPIDFSFQYLRIDPYVYTHRLKYNNYTNFGVPLGAFPGPNSESFIISSNYRPHYRIDIKFKFRYTIHGANAYYKNGSLRHNYGGDINQGYRAVDFPNAKFLNGVMEYTRDLSITSIVQPIKNYFIKFWINYISQSLENNHQLNYLNFNFSLNWKI